MPRWGPIRDIEAAKYLLRWIEKAEVESFTLRDIYQGTKGRFKKVEALEPALSLLEAQSYIRPLIKQTESRRGRKASQIYEVNPHLQSASHNSHNSHKSQERANSENSGNGHKKTILDSSLSFNPGLEEASAREVMEL